MKSDTGTNGGFKRVIRRSNDSRIRALWRGLLPAIIGQVIQLIGFVAVIVIFGSAVNGQGPIPLRLAAIVSVGIVLTAAAGVALAMSGRLDRRSYVEYGFEWSTKWLQSLVGGIAIGMVMIGAVAVYLQVRGYATISFNVSGGPDTSNAVMSLGIILGLAFYILANNAYEEVVYRGIMLQNFAEGVVTRASSRLLSVGCAMVGSLIAFGAFHSLPPGGGGGIDRVATSAGLGVVFALAYVLTGELSLPIGIHFGGLSLFVITQQSILGFTLPTFVLLELNTMVAYEILFVRVVAGIVLVSSWVYLRSGDLSIDMDLLRSNTKESS